MGWANLVDRILGQVIAHTDINTLMENIRVLGGNGTSQPNSDIETLIPLSGAGAPSSTPDHIGQIYIDTTADRQYVATATGSSADWDIVAVYKSDTVEVTGGGGDVTVNLPWSWVGGTLLIFNTNTASEYMTETLRGFMVTTYDAIVTAGYTSQEIITFADTGDVISIIDTSTAIAGQPKSATTTSFTLEGAVGTRYVKWVVIA